MRVMLSTYTTLKDERVAPYNTVLRNKFSLIVGPISTPYSTPILTISNSMVSLRNC